MGRYVDIVTQNKWNQALMHHSNDWDTINANYALTKISENNYDILKSISISVQNRCHNCLYKFNYTA